MTLYTRSSYYSHDCCLSKSLDLMASIDKYCELISEEIINKLKEVFKNFNIDFELVKQYLQLYPDEIYNNFYNGG